MGLKKNSDAGEKNLKTEKIEVGREDTELSKAPSLPDGGSRHPTLVKLDVLESILSTVDAPSQIWPQEALKAILRRYERMPRKG